MKEVEKISVSELHNRYSIGRSTLYQRLKQINIKPKKNGHSSFLEAKQLELLDALHKHIWNGGNIAEFIEMKGIETPINFTNKKSQKLPSPQANSQSPPEIPQKTKPDGSDAIAFSLKMLQKAGVSETLQASFALTEQAKLDPENEEIYENAKRLVSSQMPVEEVPMSPTELGKLIADKLDLEKAPSGRKINEILLFAGLQVAEKSISTSGKKKTIWHLTEAGKEYGDVMMDSAKGNGKTIFTVRWFSSVIPVIEKYFLESQLEINLNH